MEQPNQVSFNYSMKNIPIPTANTYKKILIEKVENVIKRMRWKASFFLKTCNNEEDDEEDDEHHPAHTENFGFKSKKCPPQIEELRLFEDDLLRMIENVKFKKVTNQFQDKLRKDVSRIKKSTKLLIPADKTRNMYEIDTQLHEKLLRQHITKNYQTTSMAPVNRINAEARTIAEKLGIDNRMESMATKQASSP
ncbi:hypothetical protein BSL78_25061 [Apostichopus japonicus]|uniref:Uncharacterized protein n=1 Tax=Stichopus japonicus TaxID=307972 RepID=A0A2G8JQV7_STIJA|nr:hypothetical protein BSL78_25061 [Apostichopus japonicus]